MIVGIDAADHAAVQPYRHLTDKREPRAPIVIEGWHALERLVSGGHAVHSVLTNASTVPRLQKLLPEAVPLLVASASLIREIAGYAFHRGVLALAPRPALPWPAALRTVVVAERVTDPSNVGALVRNARALGADAVLLDEQSGDPFSRRAIRTAMGCCFHIPIACGPVLPALQALQQTHPHLRSIAAACDAEAASLRGFTWPPCCALLVGNEGHGLSAPLAARAHARVRIPMVAGTDSLNVAAATAILLYDRMSG